MFRHIQNILKFANDWILSDIQTGGLHLVYRLRIPANLTWHAWDFYLVMTGICGNIPVTSEDFLKTSKHFPKCPQMFWRRLSTSETTLQDNNNLSCFDFVRTQKRIQSHHLTPFWIEFSLFIMCYRTLIYPDNVSQAWKIVLDVCRDLQWPKSVSAISIYSQQFQFVHSNFNLLKAISICSQQLQQQFQFAHGNFISVFHGNAILCYSIFRFAHYLSTMAADSSYTKHQSKHKIESRYLKSIFLIYCSQKIISFI